MARTKKIQTEQELHHTEINKSIRDFITFYHAVVHHTIADATQYKQSFNMLRILMEHNPETNVRVYTLDELKKVIKTLLENNIMIQGLTLLHYPNLVAFIVDDSPLADHVIKKIKDEQVRLGIYTMNELESLTPVGW